MAVAEKNKLNKIFLASFIILMFTGLGTAGVFQALAGTVEEVFLTADVVSERWTAVNGEIGKETSLENLSLETISSVDVSSQNAGEIRTFNFEGVSDTNFYIAAIPDGPAEIDSSNIQSTSTSEVDDGTLFPQAVFPRLYEDPGYDSISDSPTETFTSQELTKILDQDHVSVKTNLETSVPFRAVKYDSGSGVKPLFLADINQYSSCYDGNSCEYQLLLPLIDSQYNFYILPREDPVDATTFINGEESETFSDPGIPYKLEIETRTVFEESLVDEEVTLEEVRGNNMFIPAIDAQNYNSSANLTFETSSGTKEVLVTPSGYQSENYSFNVLVDGIKTSNLEIQGDSRVNEPDRLSDINMDQYSVGYKEGVNRLRPIGDCLFSATQQNQYYEVPVSGSDEIELVNGKPYVVNIDDQNVDSFHLKEPKSHLVFSPVRNDNFGNSLHRGKERFESSQDVLFTPTAPPEEDENLSLTTYDSSGNKLYDVNMTIPDVGTCADENSFSTLNYAKSSSFTERVNAIRPILDSMFVAY